MQEMTNRFSTSPSEHMPMALAVHYVKEMLGGIRMRVWRHRNQVQSILAPYKTVDGAGEIGLGLQRWMRGHGVYLQYKILFSWTKSISDCRSTWRLPYERTKKVRSERESRLSLIRGDMAKLFFL